MLTLTSSDDAVNPIQRDWRKLQMRLKRRKLMDDYLKVIETKEDGREHIHVIFRGSWIAKWLLSQMWEEIRHSPVVDIRKVWAGKKSKRRVASYLAKYMSKELFHRYSWSWNWVYKGFVGTWQKAKRLFRLFQDAKGGKPTFGQFLSLWQTHLRERSPPGPFLAFLSLQVRTAQGW